MAEITYNVARQREHWVVTRDGIATTRQGAQEAAFATAVAAADHDLRSGHSFASMLSLLSASFALASAV
jgi:hypothetical protein